VNDDFVTRLGVALREAADREERRPAPWRALAAARAGIPRVQPTVAVATLLAALVVAAAVIGLAGLRSDEPAPAAPKVIGRFSPAGGLDMVVPGFGSAWLVDTNSQTLLRIDPATRRVTARIPLGGAAAIVPGSNALWVTRFREGGLRLLRIDPRTNRIVAQLRLPDSTGAWNAGAVPVMVRGRLWVLGSDTAVQIDQATGRPARTVATARAGYTARSFAVTGGDLWVQTSDDRLLRFDGATGRREASLRVPTGTLISDLGMNALFVFDQASVARVDSHLRQLWRTPIESIGPAVAAHGRLWVETATGARGDRVLTVDPRTGHVIDSVDVGRFGAQFMARVGDDVWMTTAGGEVVILGR
jgi:streptogramin lyase